LIRVPSVNVYWRPLVQVYRLNVAPSILRVSSTEKLLNSLLDNLASRKLYCVLYLDLASMHMVAKTRQRYYI